MSLALKHIESPNYTEAGRVAHELQKTFLGTSGEQILTEAGRYDAKYQTTVSLASHIINTTLLGVNIYAYDVVVRGVRELDETDARVLMGALALHDVNKYIDNAFEMNAPGNTEGVLRAYFEEADDPFNVTELLPGPVEEYFDDLLYLIQRTESGEDTRDSRGTSTEFFGLESYCEVADATASIIGNDGIKAGADRLRRHFITADEDVVQTVSLTPLEQPLTHAELIRCVKDVIAGDASTDAIGVILGSAPEGVLYLGEKLGESGWRTETERVLKQRIPQVYDFACKANWKSIEYDILEQVSIPFNEKRTILATEYRETVLERGQGFSDEDRKYEALPDGFEASLPELLKAAYIDKGESLQEESLVALWDDVYDEYGGLKAKLYFIGAILDNYDTYAADIERLRERLESKLRDDLTPNVDAIRRSVDVAFGDMESGTCPSAKNSCFLCGTHTETEFKKGAGDTLFNTSAFSKRVGVQQDYKHICPSCNLEYELFRNQCEMAGVRPTADAQAVYFYFDSFVADVRMFESVFGSFLSEDTIAFDDVTLATGLLGPQYHIQPFSTASQTSKRDKHMFIVHKVLARAREYGLRAIITMPCTAFNPSDVVFLDTEATREQASLDIVTLDRFSDLDRPLALLDLITKLWSGDKRKYLQLDVDHHVPLCAIGAQQRGSDKRKLLNEYLQIYHTPEYNMLKTVADAGLELYGKKYQSKHAETSVFRTAIDAMLNGLNRGFDDEALHEFVSGQVYARAQSQRDYGATTAEQADAFTDALIEYLDANGLLGVKKLSDWRNSLTNAYMFAYEKQRDAE